MKNTVKYIAMTLVLAMPFACNRIEQDITPENEQPQPAANVEMKEITFNASVEGESTKTTLTLPGGSVAWAVDDQVNFVWELDGTPSSAVSEKLTSSDINEGNAAFTATVPVAFEKTEAKYKEDGGTSLHMYAVYPASVETDYSTANYLYVTVPAVQDGSFANASIALAKWDKTNPSAALEFKNLCGLLQIVIANDDVRKIVISSQEVIAGKVSVGFGSGYPKVNAVDTGVKEITINVSGSGTYYVSVLPCELKGFYVALFDGSDNLIGDKSTDNTLNVTRKQIRKLGTIATGLDLSNRVYIVAGGSGNGSSWDNAGGVDLLVSTMQSASTVTKNIYLGAGDYEITDKAMAPGAGSTIKVYGGYPSDPSGSALTGRDVSVNVSRITSAANSRSLRTTKGNWLFDGITFTSSGYSGSSAPGCAFLLLSGTESALFNNCTFIDCEHKGSQGGAVRVAVAATFTNCTFSNNTSTSGSAGAIWVTDAGTLTADKCVFRDNATSASGKCGGAIFNNGGAVRLTDCTFIDNTAVGSSGYGGAITSFNGTVFANRCYFRASKALAKTGGHHIDMRSGVLGLNNCVITGPFGQGVNQINNAGGSPQPLYIVNSTFHSQQSAALINNAGTGNVVNCIIVNGASSGNGISVANTGTLGLYYTLYNKAAETEGQVPPSITDCVSGILGNTACPFTGWYKTNSTTMNGNDQTSSMVVSDPRSTVHFYSWNGTLPDPFSAPFMPSLSQIKTSLGDSAFLTWLSDENLSVDIRGAARTTTAMWPGSYEGSVTKSSIENFNLK